jgi:hypothetical protein
VDGNKGVGMGMGVWVWVVGRGGGSAAPAIHALASVLYSVTLGMGLRRQCIKEFHHKGAVKATAGLHARTTCSRV